jgi:hypothetical protein
VGVVNRRVDGDRSGGHDDVGVVDRRIGDGSGGTSVLVYLLVQDGVKLVVAHLGLVEDDVVVSRTSSTLSRRRENKSFSYG